MKMLYQYTVHEHEGLLILEQEFWGNKLPAGYGVPLLKPDDSKPVQIQVRVVHGTKLVVDTKFPLVTSGPKKGG